MDGGTRGGQGLRGDLRATKSGLEDFVSVLIQSLAKFLKTVLPSLSFSFSSSSSSSSSSSASFARRQVHQPGIDSGVTSMATMHSATRPLML